MSKDNGLIYLDNAATSWPKPAPVLDAMAHFFTEIGANPGRSSHRLSIDAARVVLAARAAIAKLFQAPDPLRVVFTLNVTEALNLVLHGLLRPGDHVITGGMEHNSVMRPLEVLKNHGVQVTVLPCTQAGQLNPVQVEAAIQPNTVLIALNHASNVVGTIAPITEVGQIARSRGVLFLVDTAQTAGALPIDMSASHIDFLAFTGHKGLYGPTGTGGLLIGERVDLDRLRSLKQGGTGSRSEQVYQPEFLPDRYESGTPNTVGLAGLSAALDWLASQGVESIRKHEVTLTRRLLDGLQAIKGVTVYGPLDPELQVATVSFNINGLEPSEVGLRLDEDYGILCRVGLHCAPAAHRTMGTFPRGTVRLGLGFFNTIEHVDTVLTAVAALAEEGR